jgi:hypothetical protein
MKSKNYPVEIELRDYGMLGTSLIIRSSVQCKFDALHDSSHYNKESIEKRVNELRVVFNVAAVKNVKCY